jgi:hypothetical protein
VSEIDGDLALGVAEVSLGSTFLNPQKYAAALSISSMARRSAAVPQTLRYFGCDKESFESWARDELRSVNGQVR